MNRIEDEAAEIARIRSEYNRRRTEIPPNFYSWDRAVNLFFHTQLLRAAVAALAGARIFPLVGLRVLDVGCGRGDWLLEFCQWGAEPDKLAGIDLDENRIFEARRRLPPADLRVGDARQFPWPDGTYDLVTQFTVFTSILHDRVKRQIAAEMLRVLTPGGVVLWYDFRYNNPRNPNVRGIEAEEICGLFPGCDVKLRKVTLAPPIARALVPASWIAALALEKIPWLQTHYLGLIRKAL